MQHNAKQKDKPKRSEVKNNGKQKAMMTFLEYKNRETNGGIKKI